MFTFEDRCVLLGGRQLLSGDRSRGTDELNLKDKGSHFFFPKTKVGFYSFSFSLFF